MELEAGGCSYLRLHFLLDLGLHGRLGVSLRVLQGPHAALVLRPGLVEQSLLLFGVENLISTTPAARAPTCRAAT